MEAEKLKQTLAELHQELAQSPTLLNDETKRLLRQLALDIDEVCEAASDPIEGKLPVEKEGILDQLLSLTEEFEESHPQLAEVIGRVASALSRIGI